MKDILAGSSLLGGDKLVNDMDSEKGFFIFHDVVIIFFIIHQLIVHHSFSQQMFIVCPPGPDTVLYAG